MIEPHVLLPQLFFYMFAFLAVASGLMVVISRNSVYSVLFLIFTFFNVAGLFILLQAEFLAMLLVIVYVGAVAVLFLFVVMMLQVDYQKLRTSMKKHLAVGLAVAGTLFLEFLLLFTHKSELTALRAPPVNPIADNITNTHQLGLLLYTDYIYTFQMAGVILLVAMIGAIVLTLRPRSGVKRQSTLSQTARNRDNAIRVINVESGKGI